MNDATSEYDIRHDLSDVVLERLEAILVLVLQGLVDLEVPVYTPAATQLRVLALAAHLHDSANVFHLLLPDGFLLYEVDLEE